ncbi:unnamed protein product [Moneuplotes crassus]|uniref:Cytochrome P450 n=1 Tax=Euplotes crassus TaxID=5936 RepID=A0AAD1UD30_EUPCR|nr:unnamed protein product [Moneuplotes crassus]
MIVYFLNAFVVQPWLFKRRYRKFRNVVMSQSTSLFGEYEVVERMKKENKFMSYYLMEDGVKNSEMDIRVVFSGKQPYFLLTSCRAFKEFRDLCPKDIDRWDHSSKSFGRMCVGSLDQIRSNQDWKQRRDAIMKVIGINFSSRFIPLMIRKIKENTNAWKQNEEIDLSKEMQSTTFAIITEILFGIDIKQKIGLIDYKDFKGKVHQINFEQYITTLSKDCFKAKSHPLSILFPFMVHRNLLRPNNIVGENCQNLWRVLSGYLEQNKDDDSVYYRVLANNSSFDKDLLMRDMILFYFAGHDTSSHAISSCIFFMKKNPDVIQKCIEELKVVFGEINADSIGEHLTPQKIDELDYLTYVIKETLRYDNPATMSLGYQAINDVTVCGVPIPKKSKIFLCIAASHYSSKEWKEPEKFIPERFNPESEYFTSPDGTPVGLNVFMPFTFGLRNCAGKSLAMLEIKVVISYIILKYGNKYELDPEQKKNDFIRFGVGSQFKTKITLTE